MSFDGLEGTYRNYSNLALNFTSKDSKACAGAMRALQDRVKQLESENSDLKDKLLSLENKSANDREKYQMRTIEEVQLLKEKESILQARLQERDEAINKQQSRLINIEEQLKIKESQCRYTENEVKRNFEQYSIDIESFQLQMELMQKGLNEKSAENKKLLLFIEKSEREKTLVEEELKQERRVNQSLQSEVQFLRESSENQRNSLKKNMESVESELLKQNAEYIQKNKELEIKNKSLRELNNNQTRQIEHLKKEMGEIMVSKKVTDSQRIENFKAKAAETLKKAPVKSLSKPIFREKSPNRSVQKNKREASMSGIKESINNEDELKKLIIECEKELERLNQRYKTLIGMSYKDSGDLSTVRTDMAKTASEIDNKSEELYELKKRQQQILRAKLII